MELEIDLRLTLDEAIFLCKLLERYNWGFSSYEVKPILKKLENEKNKFGGRQCRKLN